ncbi:MAG: protein translocase SEC61 complex subunit gamma [Candidatus ainarchaeum sp.]|nr:protein translocase SEC61 complex subunit gamma [Candidatus ainarchaeum sp.]
MNVKVMLSNFISDSKRIFIVSRKPSKDEYKKMAIIIGIGIIIIGVLGFIINLIFNLAGFFGA